MSKEAKFAFWVFGFAAAGMLLYLLRGVLLPFVAGMAVAYFLDPVADRLEKWGCTRTWATSLITAAFFVAVSALTVILVPLLQAQAVGMIERAPDLIEVFRDQIAPLLENLQKNLSSDDVERLKAVARSQAGEALRWVGELMKGLWGGSVALLNLLSLILITPLAAFYLLRDWDRIITRIDATLPRRAAPTIRAQAAEIDAVIAGFVRGQATVCIILGAFYGIGLTLAGLDFGLVIGLATGLISFIPYFGMLVGLVAGLGMALVQFSDWAPIAVVAGIFIVGQVIEGNFLTPKLVGERVGLHPVWIIFALLAGGALFGFTGILLAVPAAAAIGVFVRLGMDRFVGSSLYDGDDG